MITDDEIDRLAYYTDKFEEGEDLVIDAIKLREICTEFLSLRKQNKALIEDAERLFVLVEDYGKYAYVIGTGDAIDQHEALMQEIND